jgi:hypothetical protein
MAHALHDWDVAQKNGLIGRPMRLAVGGALIAYESRTTIAANRVRAY